LLVGLCPTSFGNSEDGGPANSPTTDTQVDSSPTANSPATTGDDGTPAEETAAKAIPVHEEPTEGSPETAGEPKQGPTVQVENLQTASGPIDPKTVKILAPFPAKPLGPIPSGWRLDATNTAPTFTRKVELAEDASVVLKIRPQVLVPDADGAAVFSIQEPGYDPAFGYQQSQTVSHILTNSIRQLDDDSKALGNAIERLEQLLGSLPSPAIPPTAPLSNTKLTDQR
jgi:hypothetical protein